MRSVLTPIARSPLTMCPCHVHLSMALEPRALESQLTSNSTVPLSVNRETVCKEATRPLQWTTVAAGVATRTTRALFARQLTLQAGAGPGLTMPATLQVATSLHFEPNNRRVAKFPGQRSPSICLFVCAQLTRGVVGLRAQRASSGRW